MEDEGRYMVEVTGLSATARWADVHQFFLNCGNLKDLEITILSDKSAVAYVEFEDASSVRLALSCNEFEIVEDKVTITSCGTCHVDPSPYICYPEEAEIGNNSVDNKVVSTPEKVTTVVQEADNKVFSTPGEVATVVQEADNKVFSIPGEVLTVVQEADNKFVSTPGKVATVVKEADNIFDSTPGEAVREPSMS